MSPHKTSVCQQQWCRVQTFCWLVGSAPCGTEECSLHTLYIYISTAISTYLQQYLHIYSTQASRARVVSQEMRGGALCCLLSSVCCLHLCICRPIRLNVRLKVHVKVLRIIVSIRARFSFYIDLKDSFMYLFMVTISQ